MSKILDNKYKIGQKVWVANYKMGKSVCSVCGYIHRKDGKYFPLRAEIVRMEKVRTKDGDYIEYEVEGIYMAWSWRDLFLTKAEAQARCDELNKEAQ